MKIIKFGGTAFQTPKLVNNVFNIIKKEDKPLIVVVSAIGRKGFPFATDTLIDSIKEQYFSKKEMDRLLGIGEIYSSLFLSNYLMKNGLDSYSMSYIENGIEVDENGNIYSLNDECYINYFKEKDILIVPGFIASNSKNEIVTMGRGTSDLTTILLGELFKEKRVTLYKEVDGIYPTLFINLLKIKPYEYLSYKQVLALIDIGFSPVNKKAIEEAERENIEIEIKNFIENNNRTLISNIESENKVIGFNVDNNLIKIATFYKEEIKRELFELLKLYHIYIKEDQEGENYFSFKINASQILMFRQIILEKYFFKMKNI